MSSEKSNGQLEVNTSESSGMAEMDHLELKHHTSAEISSSGKWYDKRVVSWIPPYSNAMVQIVMLSFVVFMTPGMYNALTGIGASISDVTTSDDANVALYCTFAGIGFFSGTICNTFGVRACLMFGGTGYALYAGSLLCFNHTENRGFVIFAGAFLGICASCLWAAQGAIITAYPSEGAKGRGIMVFWVIFNLGGVIGSIIPLANNMHNEAKSANDGTFIAFIVLMCSGVVIASFMLPMSKVWKSDGTRVVTVKQPHWKDEIIQLGKLLIHEPMILFLFPMFFSSNWFYAYQFNDFNAGRFNLRTRSLNSLLYWFCQMVGAILMGSILDLKWFNRKSRAKIGFVFLMVMSLAIWGGGLKFQLEFTREDVKEEKFVPLDFKSGSYIGPMFLYMFYGCYDAFFQNYVLWIIGALSNNPRKTAIYAGFYKGLQSAGAAISWRLDSMEKPYIDLFASSWALVIGSLLIAIPVIFFRITNHTTLEEDDITKIVNVEELVSIKSGIRTPLVEEEIV